MCGCKLSTVRQQLIIISKEKRQKKNFKYFQQRSPPGDNVLKKIIHSSGYVSVSLSSGRSVTDYDLKAKQTKIQKLKEEKHLRPGSINGSHSFYRSLGVAEVRWDRLAGPNISEENRSSKHLVAFQSGGERKPVPPHLKRMPKCHGCLTNPQIKQVLQVIMGTHSYKTRSSEGSSSSEAPPPPISHLLHLLVHEHDFKARLHVPVPC